MTWTIHTGDCRTVLATLPESSIDTVICDPPYGLAFMGKEWDQSVPGPDYWRAALRVAKPGAMLLAFGGTRTWHHLAVAIEAAGWEIRDSLMWLYGSGFPKSLDVSKAIDKSAGATREVIGVGATSCEYLLRGEKCLGHGDAGKSQDHATRHMPITAASTDAAKLWTGWGTALKPAWEPIILAMKPLDGTFAENAQRHGVAGLAIDAGRIPHITVEGGTLAQNTHLRASVRRAKGDSVFGTSETEQAFRADSAGRWPANVLLDEEAAAALDAQSGDLTSGVLPAGTKRQGLGYNGADGNVVALDRGGDTGGASRFFYVAKAARSERGVGNDHPTVKPADLMRYLCRLTRTPTGGTVLDPFAGSGSTGVGAMLDGRDFVGIELDPHNADIARQRIGAADPVGRQESLFAST